MGKTGKQADRNAAKKAAKSVDAADPAEPAGAASPSELLERAKALLLGSCAAAVVPELQALLSPESGATNGHAEKPKEESERPKEDEAAAGGQDENAADNGGGETAPKASVGDKATELFASISDELSLFNVLGLAEPKGVEASKQGWLDLKELELDWGPRPKKRGSPVFDRVMTNLTNNMPQYFHVLLAQMVLRAFLFRSWFACLPWLLFYQIVSLIVPLDGLPQLPQVPIDQCPVKFRVAGTMAIHSLMWFFFLWELVYCTYFLEKVFVWPWMVLGHAYAVRPAGK